MAEEEAKALGSDLDTSRPFRSYAQMLALVTAVRDGLLTPEPDWLEWKTYVDLTSRAGQAKVAKFILGASNRPLPQAARHTDGCAYLLLGVEPNNVTGAVPLDPEKLEPKVRNLIGPKGPEWVSNDVRIDGKDVLVITVWPTRPGQRPFVARRSSDEINEGRIYIRRPGSTAEAKAEDIEEMFAERDAAHREGDAHTRQQSRRLRIVLVLLSFLLLAVTVPQVISYWNEAFYQAENSGFTPNEHKIAIIFLFASLLTITLATIIPTSILRRAVEARKWLYALLIIVELLVFSIWAVGLWSVMDELPGSYGQTYFSSTEYGGWYSSAFIDLLFLASSIVLSRALLSSPIRSLLPMLRKVNKHGDNADLNG